MPNALVPTIAPGTTGQTFDNEIAAGEPLPIVFDMEHFLRMVPPIEGEFIPALEVRKILTFRNEERRERLTDFKDKLARQQEAWILFKNVIELELEASRDSPPERLIGILNLFASAYGFDPNAVEKEVHLIEECVVPVRVREI